jgi:L-fuculose-phosphate aldolase
MATTSALRTSPDAAAGAPAAVVRSGRRALRRASVELLRAAAAMADSGLVVGTVGNVSVRVGDVVRITPTRCEYAGMRRRDLVTVDVDSGRTLRRGAPSRELPLHLAVYRARPDAAAVIHTHSPAASAWSFLGEPLGPELEDLAYYDIGPVRTAVPAPAGSEALAASVVAAVGGSRAVLLGEHGVLALGPTPAAALTVARVVEHQAQVAWYLRAGRLQG